MKPHFAIFFFTLLLVLAGCTQDPAHTLEDLLHPSSSGVLKINKVLLVNTNLEIPATVSVQFLPKGRLVLAPGIELRILGTITAPSTQWIFEPQAEDSSLVAPQLATVYPHWWGAKGNGVTNDSKALRHTAKFINRRGGGTIFFVPGIYLVGEQKLAGALGKGCSYCPEDLLHLKDTTSLVTVLGNGAVLKAADGLRFGSFDPITGTAINPSLPFTDSDYAAHAYWGMVQLTNNTQVEVRDLELDGNINGLMLGGFFGDTGQQVAAYGIYALSNDSVSIQNVYSHHHGLDGILIGYPGLTDPDPPTPHTLLNVQSEYNARQGLSWVGGNGLTAQQCSFSHTGRARFATAPAAGLDIEAEDAVVRNGLFEDCQFVDNVGVGMVADSGDGGYSTFRRSLFWGTSTYAIWPNKPQLRFEDCTVYGTVVRAYSASDPTDAVSFSGCHIEDIQGGTYPVFTSPAGLLELDANNLLIENSTITANTTRGIFLDGIFSQETLRNVTIEHRHDDLINGDFQSLLRGVRLEQVTFSETYPGTETKQWYIAVENESCQNVTVTGPKVLWKNPVSGATGLVCP